jgi:hypothetical protein
MHSIKYFFSIKIIRQFSEDNKIFQGENKLSKNTIFQNSGGGTYPLLRHLGPPMLGSEDVAEILLKMDVVNHFMLVRLLIT